MSSATSSASPAALKARIAEQEVEIRELALQAQHLEGQMDILVKEQVNARPPGLVPPNTDTHAAPQHRNRINLASRKANNNNNNSAAPTKR